MTHICVSRLTSIGSDNGLSPERRQAIIWTNVRILLIGPLGTNFSEMLIEMYTFSFKKMHFKMSVEWQPIFVDLNVLRCQTEDNFTDHLWSHQNQRKCFVVGIAKISFIAKQGTHIKCIHFRAIIFFTSRLRYQLIWKKEIVKMPDKWK